MRFENNSSLHTSDLRGLDVVCGPFLRHTLENKSRSSRLFFVSTQAFPLSLLGARTRLVSSYLAVLIMASYPNLTSPPVFLSLLPSGPWALPPGARV